MKMHASSKKLTLQLGLFPTMSTSKKLTLQLGIIDCKGATSMMLLTWWGIDQYSKPQAPTWPSPLKV
jgi:hypothetical protein